MHFPRNLLLFTSCFCIPALSSADTGQAPEIATITQCPIPSYPKLAENQTTQADNTIKILSKKTNIEKDQFAKFTGGVTLINKQQTIVADKLEINRAQALIKAQGDIHFQNQNIDIFADQLSASESSNATQLDNTSYQLAQGPGHGSAKLIAVDADGTLLLQDSTFTTCYGETPDWQLKASQISISANEKSLQAYNARFRLFGMPVLYIPYF